MSQTGILVWGASEQAEVGCKRNQCEHMTSDAYVDGEEQELKNLLNEGDLKKRDKILSLAPVSPPLL